MGELLPVKASNFLPNFPLLLTKSITSCLKEFDHVREILCRKEFSKMNYVTSGINCHLVITKMKNEGQTWIKDDCHNPRKFDLVVSFSRLQQKGKQHPV